MLRLQTFLRENEATPARITKEPESVRRWLAMRGTQSRLAQGGLESFLRLACFSCHEKTKAIKLRKILIRFEHAGLRKRILRTPLAQTRPLAAMLAQFA